MNLPQVPRSRGENQANKKQHHTRSSRKYKQVSNTRAAALNNETEAQKERVAQPTIEVRRNRERHAGKDNSWELA